MARAAPDLVVYTAIFGGRDELREPLFHSPDVSHVCFTDDPAMRARGWYVRCVPRDPSLTPRRQAKRYKLLPHRHLGPARQSLWLDGSFSLAVDARWFVERHLAHADFAAFAHPERDCLYDEAQACIGFRNDDPAIIAAQIERYRREQHPEHAGLIYGGVLARRHTPEVIAACEAWWREIEQGSVRDQVSFNYVARRERLACATLPGHCWDNPFLRYRAHTG